MAEGKWKLAFREDQVRFIVHALEHISIQCVQQSDGTSDIVRKFTAARTQERAEEIIEYINTVTT